MDFYPIDSDNLSRCVELFVSMFNNPPWNEHWTEAAVAARLQECYHTPGFYGLIVEVEGASAGFALGYTEQWDQTRHFYLKEMCVASHQQRSGVGTALMQELEGHLKEAGVERLYLYTSRESGAQSFYEKQGFYVSSKMVMMGKWLTSS